MSGLQNVDLHGYWWLPENASHKIAGHLTISPEGSSLFLYGSLAGDPHRLHGTAQQVDVTLDDCFQTFSDVRGDPLADRQTLYVGRAVTGMLLGPGAQLEAGRIAVRMRYLTNWLAPTEIEQEDGPSSPAGPRSSVSLTVEGQPPQTVPLPRGAALRLTHKLLANGSYVTSRTLHQQYVAEIVPSELTALDDLVDRVSDLQDLVSIATRRSAELEQVTFFHPSETWPADDEVGVQVPLALHQRIQVVDRVPDKEEPRPFNFLFSVDELGGLDGIARWMAVAEVNRDTLGRAMAVSYSKGMFVSDRFLNYIAALEGYDKRHNPTAKKQLSSSLNRCVRKAGDPFKTLVGPHTSRWVGMAVDHRHDIAHHKGKHFHGSSGDQYFLGEAGYWLNLLCLLRDAEAPDAVFERIVKHGDFQFVQERLTGILATGSH